MDWASKKSGGPDAFISSDSGDPALLFGKPLTSFERAELVRDLKIYNVSFVVSRSSASREFFQQYPEDFAIADAIQPQASSLRKDTAAILMDSSDPANNAAIIFKVTSYEPSYLLEGTGEVKAGFNRIEITNPSQGQLLLKYHWVKDLKAPKGVWMKPVNLGIGRAPFISLNNNSSASKIVISYN